MDELTLTLKAMRDKTNQERKFLAAIQGIDLDENENKGDITELRGYEANETGFGIGLGLGYSSEGE